MKGLVHSFSADTGKCLEVGRTVWGGEQRAFFPPTLEASSYFLRHPAPPESPLGWVECWFVFSGIASMGWFTCALQPAKLLERMHLGLHLWPAREKDLCQLPWKFKVIIQDVESLLFFFFLTHLGETTSHWVSHLGWTVEHWQGFQWQTYWRRVTNNVNAPSPTRCDSSCVTGLTHWGQWGPFQGHLGCILRSSRFQEHLMNWSSYCPCEDGWVTVALGSSVTEGNSQSQPFCGLGLSLDSLRSADHPSRKSGVGRGIRCFAELPQRVLVHAHFAPSLSAGLFPSLYSSPA